MAKQRKPQRTGLIKPIAPKFCKLCGADITELDCRRTYCDSCREKSSPNMKGKNKSQLSWHERNKEQLKAKKKAKLDAIKANPEAYEQLKAKWRKNWEERKKQGKVPTKEHLRKYHAQWRKENREYINQENKKYRRIDRQKVLDHYGKVCACCGESRYEFLAIDHIHGGGNKHRKELIKKREIGNGGRLHDWLRKNNYPEGFRVLCHNCNQAMGLYGYCPHNPTGENQSQNQVVE